MAQTLSPAARQLALFAALGSALLLAGAFAFQYLGGLWPCTLCLWQRYPHALAVLVGAVLWRSNLRWLTLLGAALALTSAGIGVFHVGVEQGWWQGLATCSAGSIEGISASDLLDPNADVAAPVRCDKVAWSLFGISMAGWNVILSAALSGGWLTAFRRG